MGYLWETVLVLNPYNWFPERRLPAAGGQTGRAAAALAMIVLLGVWPTPSPAQPGTDIYIAPLQLGQHPVIGVPENITGRGGYDNQPFFSPDGSYLLFASADTSGQTDVFRYGFAAGVTERLTHTVESEYSPTILPRGDGFSTVRVEADGVTQRLWRFDLDGSHPQLVMADVDSVGYHTWLDGENLVLFIVGDPHTLRRVHVPTQNEQVIARDVGRSVFKVPGQPMVSFTQPGNDGFVARIYDAFDGQIIEGAEIPDGGQDLAWAGNGTMFASGGTTVYAYLDNQWLVVQDLSVYGLSGLTRLAVAPDGSSIAIVADDR